MTKRKGQSITIRLDDALAEKLQTVATRHNVARSAVIVDLLLGSLDTWQPGTTERHDRGTTERHDDGHDRGTTGARLDELATAIEELRSGLAEMIARVGELEAAKQLAPATGKPGRSLGQIAFDLKLTQSSDDRNYDKISKSRHGVKFRDYLTSQGWTQHKRLWFEPRKKRNHEPPIL